MSLQRSLQKGQAGQSFGPWPSIGLSQMGQRIFLIGIPLSRLGIFRGGLTVRVRFTSGLARGAVGVAGRSGRVGLGGTLVGVATVVGLVEARSLEQDRGPGADQPAQLVLLALRALLERRFAE